MLTKLLAIARNTFTETIRQPIFGLLVLVIMGCLAINTATAAFSTSPSEEIYDDDKMLYDLGLSTLLVGGLFLAAFSSAGVLSREIENKTVLTVIAKPVSRPVFVIGKFLGLTGALTCGYYLCSTAFFLSARHGVMQASSQHMDWPVLIFGFGAVLLAFGIATFCNYYYGWQFVSTCLVLGLILMTMACGLVGFIDKEWSAQAFATKIIDKQLHTAVILVFFAVMVLTAVALAASTRLGQVMTLMVCFVVLGLGLTSDYFFQPYAFPEYKPLATTQPSAADDPRLRDPNELGERGTAVVAEAEPPGDQTAEAEDAAARAPAPIPEDRAAIVEASRETARTLARIVYAVIPNMQVFWVSDAVILRRPIPASYVGKVGIYALTYILALLFVSVGLFQSREVAADESASTAPAVVHLLAMVGRIAAAVLFAAGVWIGLTETVKPGQSPLWMPGGMVAAGVFLWFFWGWFARGIKWTWFVAIVLVGIAPLGYMLYVLITQQGVFTPLFALPGVVSVLTLTIISKKNRIHFGFDEKPKRRRRSRAQLDAA